jgi:hypothetical protein
MENCPCCSGSCVEIDLYDDFIYKKLIRCDSCSHIKVSSSITSSELLEYYENQYSEKRDTFFSDEYISIMKKRSLSQFVYINNYINLRANQKILDIGTGYGFLLSQFESKGFSNVIGLEFDDKCIEFCKKKSLDVRKIQSEKHFSEIKKSHLICLSHALEHFINIKKVIDDLRKKCNYLFVEVPLYDENIKTSWIDQEGHINFFNEKSLELFFNNNNFRVINISRFGPDLKYYWEGSKFSKYFKRKITGDWFFDKYSENERGMWIRILLKSS